MTPAPAGLLNARQLCQRLNISERTYYTYKPLGRFKPFEVKRPLGRYRYSAQLVDEFLAGRPVSQFGQRHP